jgi:hypothetical protein
LHVLTVLNKLTSNDDKAVKHIAIDPALVFFMVFAVLDLLVVLEHLHAEGSLHLEVTHVAYRLGKIGKLIRKGRKGSIIEGSKQN